MNNFAIAIRMSLLTLFVTGIVYPVVSTGVATVLFPKQAAGSLAKDEKGNVIGSELLAQPFARAAYFQPRPSAAGDKGFDATASGGSNLGSASQKLHDRVSHEILRLRRENPEAPREVPLDLVTASASGLDPHLSPEAAYWQVPRVARARGLDPERVRRLVASSIEGRDLGFLGEPRVNVLLLDLALDRQFGRPGG